jgi:hypothetical protein
MKFNKILSNKIVLAAVMLSPFIFGGASWYQSGKVTICHVPPGNPTNYHTLEVSQNALQAHLDHGDCIGSCESHENGPITVEGSMQP